ncbi:hypothetical protein EDD98_5974 [Streptomyces sp. PanSC19]|uniref:hypothetical protein n=1 Tax=Streptomyces sp. PanSC19 TaxID=1520455 RepID=UPI000FB416C2|nr:hypothetical protein [Streptomyces sp. PanSC19]ROQ26344.1 hypothetical protein EDD98_5974 [Streptomyces sp. PanSC19]
MRRTDEVGRQTAGEGADEEMWTSTYARLSAETRPHIAATAHLPADRMNHSACPVILDTLLGRAEAQPAATRKRAATT